MNNRNDKWLKSNFEITIPPFEPIAEPDVTLVLPLPSIHFGINVRFQPEAFAVKIRWPLPNKFVFLSHGLRNVRRNSMIQLM